MTLAAIDEMTDVLGASVFGGGLPPEAESLLHQAGQSYDQAETALAHLREARRLAPNHVAVLIGLYRFFFYKGRLVEALDIARTCLLRAAIDNSLPLDWRLVRPGQAAFASFDAPMARFFMFVLKGYAYLNMRLGDIEEGRAAVAKAARTRPQRQGWRRDPARGSRTTGARRCRLKSTRRSTGSALPWTATFARIFRFARRKNVSRCAPACLIATLAASIGSSIGTPTSPDPICAIPTSKCAPARPRPPTSSCCRPCFPIRKKPCAGAPRDACRKATF